MESPEHLLTFISIIIGLAFTRLLDSIGKSIEHRAEIKHFPLLYAWALSVFPAMMQIWWGMWEAADELKMNAGFRYSLLSVAMPTTWFFLSELLFPDDFQRFRDHYGSSQRVWYYAQKRWLFLISTGIMLLYAVNGAILFHQGITSSQQIIRLTLILIYLYLAFENTRSERRRDLIHWVGWSTNMALFVVFLFKNK